MRKTINTRYKNKNQRKPPRRPRTSKKREAQLAKRMETHKNLFANDPEYLKMVDAYNAKQREKRKLKCNFHQLMNEGTTFSYPNFFDCIKSNKSTANITKEESSRKTATF